MSTSIIQFVRSKLHEQPAAIVPAAVVVGLFREASGSRTPRHQLLDQLREAGFVVAKNSDNIDHIVGVSIEAPQPVMVEDGRIKKR